MKSERVDVSGASGSAGGRAVGIAVVPAAAIAAARLDQKIFRRTERRLRRPRVMALDKRRRRRAGGCRIIWRRRRKIVRRRRGARLIRSRMSKDARRPSPASHGRRSRSIRCADRPAPACRGVRPVRPPSLPVRRHGREPLIASRTALRALCSAASRLAVRVRSNSPKSSPIARSSAFSESAGFEVSIRWASKLICSSSASIA